MTRSRRRVSNLVAALVASSLILAVAVPAGASDAKRASEARTEQLKVAKKESEARVARLRTEKQASEARVAKLKTDKAASEARMRRIDAKPASR